MYDLNYRLKVSKDDFNPVLVLCKVNHTWEPSMRVDMRHDFFGKKSTKEIK